MQTDIIFSRRESNRNKNYPVVLVSIWITVGFLTMTLPDFIASGQSVRPAKPCVSLYLPREIVGVRNRRILFWFDRSLPVVLTSC